MTAIEAWSIGVFQKLEGPIGNGKQSRPTDHPASPSWNKQMLNPCMKLDLRLFRIRR
jgi:hypothetical protein